jgi:pyridoxal 5'-phosphate synthase pdxT subunit
MKDITVGVLALQGAFAKHMEMLTSLGVDAIEVRKPAQLQKCQGLIIPGGESTTIFKQIQYSKMAADLLEFSKNKPIFGTCAGLILMSKKIAADPMVPFGILDVEVARNAFGRQNESFRLDINLHLDPKTTTPFSCLFIRAPKILTYESQVQVLGEYEGLPILIRQGFHLGATFHPELTDDPTLHQYFIDLIKQSA